MWPRAACVVPSSLSSRVCCRVQDGKLPLHCAALYNNSQAVIKVLLAAYPDAAKATTNGQPHKYGMLNGYLPLHYAAQYNKSEAVIKALVDAYPDAAKEKEVRCSRGRRVLCPLLSLLTCVCVAVCSMGSCRSTMPLSTTSQRQ